MEQSWPPSWSKDWHALLAAAAATVVVNMLTTLLRFTARKRETTRTERREGLYFDDWFILFAAVTAAIISWIDFGLAIHLTSTPRPKLLWTVFGEGMPPSRYCTTGPNERYQDRIIATSIVHFVISLAILITPFARVALLPNKRSHKCILLLLYTLGWVTLVFSAFRFYYLLERLHKPAPETLHYFVKAVMWSLIEINTSITLLNMPALMPIVDWCLDIWVWFRAEKQELAAGATHGRDAINSMLLKPTRPRMNLSDSEADRENQAQRRSGSATEAGRRSFGLERTSSGSLHVQEIRRQYRVINEWPRREGDALNA
ncbi:MAG: hypothetical protein Q9191_003974 [Dirinaria sp. TL-2023a]